MTLCCYFTFSPPFFYIDSLPTSLINVPPLSSLTQQIVSILTIFPETPIQLTRD